MRAVSLFSNCGAGDLGYSDAGFQFTAMAEIDDRRLKVAGLNHPAASLIPGDIRNTWPQVVESFREDRSSKRTLDLLASCPPCQGMSSARSDRGRESDPQAGARDPRNLLVVPIIEVARALKPRLVVVENVRAFLTKKVPDPESGNGISAAKLLISHLKEEYVVFPALLDLSHYGVPQRRKRAFLTFVRRSEDMLHRLFEAGLTPYPAPTHADAPVTLGEALEEFALPPLDAGSNETARAKGLPMHHVPVWPDRRYDMVEAIPPNSGLSAWENNLCPECGEVDVGPTAAICPTCQMPLLRPVVEDPVEGVRLVKGFHSSYRRMDPTVPAATIATPSGHIGSDRTIHPSENRVLSPLECALLQTFPETFAWGDSLQEIGHTNVRAMIGEAVPPHFTRLHGEVLHDLLDGVLPETLLHATDLRVKSARKKLGLTSSESS